MENRLVRSGGSPVAWAYSYAPGNKRVWRGVWSSGTQTVDELTFWSVSGQKLETYQLSQYQPWPGDDHTLPQLVASQTGTSYYFGGKLVKNSMGYVTPDRLGSIGKYFPYGQERPSATTDGKEKFATYFRDSETGLDYAENRYHQVGMGRFMTPDPWNGSGKPNDPGSWNRYAYTRGDPVNRGDPAGTCDGPADTNTSMTVCASFEGLAPVPGWNYDGAAGVGGGGSIASDACSNGYATLGYLPDYLAAMCVDGGFQPPQQGSFTEKTLTKGQNRDVGWLPSAQDYLKTFDTSNQDCLTDLAAVGLSVDAVRNMDYTLTAASGNAKSIYDNNGIVFYTDPSTQAITYDSQNFYQNSFKQLLGSLLHEFSHMGGLDDGAVAGILKLNLKKDPVTDRLISTPISKKFTKDCFSGVKNP